MSNIEYRDLLFDISEKLDVNKLPRLVFMCKDEIAKGSERNIRDVLTLFEELEKQNRLGIDRLDTLKQILTQMKERSLLRKVEKFEIKRKALSVGIISSLKRAAASITGAVKLVCNVRTITGGLLVVSSAMALRSCTSLDEFVEAFNKVVLVSYSKLIEIREGSLCFTVQAETSSALKELWDIYESGTLQNRLQEFLVTEEVKQLASGEDVVVTVYIDEQEYKEAYLDLMLLENPASETEEDGIPGGKPRRNSDSFLCFKPNEVDSALMRLKQAENKWNFLEEENEKLKTKIAEAGNLKRFFWHEEEGAQKAEDIERPRKRRRRNSDSNLYCKARDKEVKESKKEREISLEEETKYLDSEREAFVQNYLQGIIHETHSMTTETSDSGIRTHGAPSDLDEFEHVPDYSQAYCLKHLGSEVISKLQRALDVDDVARGLLNQSFGIKGNFRRKKDIFTLLPSDTPVKLLNDVLETLQLYDLLDLLSEKPQHVRSLRRALPLPEIEKLRKTADLRPTTYHSNVAVLIIADVENSDIKGLKNFFKGLNSKSDVTIIECENALRTKLVINRMKFQVRPTFRYDYDDDEEKMTLEGVRKEIRQQQEFQKEIGKKEEELQKEIENIKTSVSAVIDSWIRNQGNFSLFAVFQFCMYSEWEFGPSVPRTLGESITEKLVSGIPDKIKFIIGPPAMVSLEPAPETLKLVTDPIQFESFRLQLLKILNKRWQTLDLISMMKQLKRT